MVKPVSKPMIDLQQIKLAEGAPDSGLEWTLLAAGDFCAISRFMEKGSLEDKLSQVITGELHDLIATADIAIVNMEGPIRTSSASIPKSGPAIQMDVAVPSVLKSIGFDVVSLANNHIMDYGPQALHCTIEACEDEKLLVCGAGENLYEAVKPAERVVAGGIRVAVLAFCEQEFGVAHDEQPGSAWISHPQVVKRVAEAAETADVVVVLAHGGVEEVPFSPIQRQAQLRQFIDAGATLVIGHHPHVPQGWELYRQGVVFHSLGNFLFDYPGGARFPKTEWGLVIQAHFYGTALGAVEVVPVETLANRRVSKLGQNRNPQQCLGYLHRLSTLLAAPDAVVPYWQETAIHLWRTRYQPWLQSACAINTLASDDSIRSHLLGLYRGVRRRLGRLPHMETASPPDVRDGLLLLNTVRNESHRWTVETALAVLYGDEVDRRTPEVRTEMNELLSWTEG